MHTLRIIQMFLSFKADTMSHFFFLFILDPNITIICRYKALKICEDGKIFFFFWNSFHPPCNLIRYINSISITYFLHNYTTFSYFCMLIINRYVGTMTFMVEGEICTEKMCGYGIDCNPKCIWKYPGGKGSCDISSGAPICRCYFKYKECQETFDIAMSCDNKACNEKCAAKFPEPQ